MESDALCNWCKIFKREINFDLSQDVFTASQFFHMGYQNINHPKVLESQVTCSVLILILVIVQRFSLETKDKYFGNKGLKQCWFSVLLGYV